VSSLLILWKALSAGWQLKKAGMWNKLAAVLAMIAPALFFLSKWAAAKGWIPAEMTQEEVDQLSYWLLQGNGIATAYWLRATSTSVGWGEDQGQVLEEPEAIESRPSAPSPAPAGVLFRDGGLREVSSVSSPSARHPGDDPGLGSFN